MRVLAADPDLARFLHPAQAQVARRYVVAEVRSLEGGCWRAHDDPAVAKATFGLLVLEGVLARRAEVGRRGSLELLGFGDVLCPDLADCDAYPNVPQRGRWRVLISARMAVLDDDLVAGLAGLRQVLAELNRRAFLRSRALALRLALVKEPCLETRLELLLWHLADRWGRREADASVLSLPLNRDLVAELANAHPSAVGRALERLSQRGRFIRRPDGAFALLGDPPATVAGPS
jgi:CRP/FNR family transcriptional regulator, cyclic AMP receptor protein